ncbi:MAG TPA: DUF2784 family protein [Polyangiaceae bacterium]|jgi:hypothetical protein|nr:DUF2784 family protein [Polyangiaceae bacterium]
MRRQADPRAELAGQDPVAQHRRVFVLTSHALAALDWFLTALHVGIVLAFVFLWIPKSTALWHGRLVALVAFSWLVIGLLEGSIGYCVLTDLHWRVKRARGITHLPGSFLKYVVDYVTGANVSPALINRVAATTFVGVCCAAIFRRVQARRAL